MSEKAGAMPKKYGRVKKLGQCPRNVNGRKNWGNAPEIKKRQMIGSEEKNAPVFLPFFSFSEILVHKLVESIQMYSLATSQETSLQVRSSRILASLRSSGSN